MLIQVAIGGFVEAKLVDGYNTTTINMYECRLLLLFSWLNNLEKKIHF